MKQENNYDKEGILYLPANIESIHKIEDIKDATILFTDEEILRYIDLSYEVVISKVLRIYELLSDFYGEDRVDLQNLITKETFTSILKEITASTLFRRSNPVYAGVLSDTIWISIRNNRLFDIPKVILENLFVMFFNKDVLDTITDTTCINIMLIHFPEVVITNENDRSTIGYDYYLKFKVGYNGTLSGTFAIHRATYQNSHLFYGYRHSHTPSLNGDNILNFTTPCLGDGPINGTISNLNHDYDEDIWNLFFLELNQYIHTESIAGIPYMYLERIGQKTEFLVNINPRYITRRRFVIHDTYNELIKAFAKYLIESKVLKFNYTLGSFGLAMSPYDFICTMSNCFISFMNGENDFKEYMTLNYLLESKIIFAVKTNGIEFNTIQRRNNITPQYEGRHILSFKDKSIKLRIIEDVEEDVNTIHIINPYYAYIILNRILKTLNYRYNEHNNSTIETINTSENSSSHRETVFYL